MANNVTTYVYASENVLKALINEAGEVDFSLLLPMPADDDPVFTATLQETVRRDGSTDLWWDNDGYSPKDWAIDNWGTKWNAYRSVVDLDKGVVKFNTAASTPYPVIKALSLKFPEDELIFAYADEDLGYNLGIYAMRGGLLIRSVKLEEGSDDALAVAEAIAFLDLLGDEDIMAGTSRGDFVNPKQFLELIHSED